MLSTTGYHIGQPRTFSLSWHTPLNSTFRVVTYNYPSLWKMVIFLTQCLSLFCMRWCPRTDRSTFIGTEGTDAKNVRGDSKITLQSFYRFWGSSCIEIFSLLFPNRSTRTDWKLGLKRWDFIYYDSADWFVIAAWFALLSSERKVDWCINDVL